MNVPPLLQSLLWPLAFLYGVGVRARVWLYANKWFKQKRLKATVISVGNLTVGGTGKTPMVIWLAEKFLGDGKRVAILSRGYRGTDRKSTRLNSSHITISYAVFCLKKKKHNKSSTSRIIQQTCDPTCRRSRSHLCT